MSSLTVKQQTVNDEHKQCNIIPNSIHIIIILAHFVMF